MGSLGEEERRFMKNFRMLSPEEKEYLIFLAVEMAKMHRDAQVVPLFKARCPPNNVSI